MNAHTLNNEHRKHTDASTHVHGVHVHAWPLKFHIHVWNMQTFLLFICLDIFFSTHSKTCPQRLEYFFMKILIANDFFKPLRYTDSLNRLFVSDYLLSALPLLSQLFFIYYFFSSSLDFIFLFVDVLPKTERHEKREKEPVCLCV